MAEQTAARLWGTRALYVAISLAILFVCILPLHTLPRYWAGPDLLLALTLVWSLRKRRAVPILIVAAVALLADLMLQRPPGLWAAILVIGSEWLKSHARQLRDQSFATEWLTVATLIVLMALAYRITLAMTVTQMPPLGLYVMQVVATIVIYPLVVGVSHVVFGIRKAQPGDLESMGRQRA